METTARTSPMTSNSITNTANASHPSSSKSPTPELSPNTGTIITTGASPIMESLPTMGVSSHSRISPNWDISPKPEASPESEVSTLESEISPNPGISSNVVGSSTTKTIMNSGVSSKSTLIIRNYQSLESTPVVRNYLSTETRPVMQHHQNKETTQIRQHYKKSTETTPVMQNNPNTPTTTTTQNTNATPIWQNSRKNTETTPLLQNHPNHPETTPILQNHPETTPDPPNSPDLQGPRPSPTAAADVSSKAGKKNMALLTLITFLVACAGRIHSPVLTQYVYQMYTDSIYGNESQGVHISQHPCLNASAAAAGSGGAKGGGGVSNSSSGPSTPGGGADPRNQEVQDKSADLLMHLDMVSGSISILVNLLLGSYSDHLGRRFLLLVPTLGHFVRNASAPVIIYWSLGLPALYVGYVVDGLCGGSAGILLGLYVYAADITRSDQQRTLGMSIVETCLGLTTAMSSLGAGYFIEDTGFFYPSLASSLILLVSVFVIIFWLPETVARDRKRCFSPLKGGKRVLSVFFSHKNARQGTLLRLALFAFFLGVLPSFSDSKLRELYVMDPPFCWSSIQIGIFLSVKDGGSRIVSLVFIQLLRACVLTPVLAMMGAASVLGSDILMALSWNDLMVYLVAGVSMGGSMLFPSLRSMMSRMAPPDQQGALFAGIGVVESLCYCLSQFCFLSLYRYTAHVLQGLVYLVIGGFHFLLIFVLIIYLCLMRTAVTGEEEKTINVQEEEPSES